MSPGGQEGKQHPDLYQQSRNQQDQGSDCPPVLSIGEAEPWVLGSGEFYFVFNFRAVATKKTLRS